MVQHQLQHQEEHQLIITRGILPRFRQLKMQADFHLVIIQSPSPMHMDVQLQYPLQLGMPAWQNVWSMAMSPLLPVLAYVWPNGIRIVSTYEGDELARIDRPMPRATQPAMIVTPQPAGASIYLCFNDQDSTWIQMNCQSIIVSA